MRGTLSSQLFRDTCLESLGYRSGCEESVNILPAPARARLPPWLLLRLSFDQSLLAHQQANETTPVAHTCQEQPNEGQGAERP